MAYILGQDAKCFRGPAGAKATTEVKNVKSITVDMQSGETDVSTRATKGWKAFAATLKEATIDIELLYDPEDEDFNAFKNAYFQNSPIALFIADGYEKTAGTGGTTASTGGEGMDADFSITGFTVEQPLEEAITVKIKARPTASSRAPKWE